MELVNPFIHNYSWANKDIKKNICHLFAEDDLPIAELWYGTHINGHSYINSTTEFLHDYIGRDMKYLYKFLSVGSPLSLQVHPDEDNAIDLHCKYPEEFPDPRAKWECAVCLSDYAYILCGIRPIKEIKTEIYTYFSDILGPYQNPDHWIRDAIIQILDMTNTKYEIIRSRLYHRSDFFRMLENHHPDDRGCAISVLFLNKIRLDKWDAILIPPNTIHSYISGNLFEVMVSSDNVIRLGMTPKYKNYSAFFKCANFQPSKPIINKKRCIDSNFEHIFKALPNIRIIKTETKKVVLDVYFSYALVFVLNVAHRFKINDKECKKYKAYIFRMEDYYNTLNFENSEEKEWSVIIVSI